MASLTITASRNDDNSITVSVTIPPRHNGGENFGCLGRINHVLLPVNPDAFDPKEVPHAVEAPMPPHLAELQARQSDEPEAALNFNTGAQA